MQTLRKYFSLGTAFVFALLFAAPLVLNSSTASAASTYNYSDASNDRITASDFLGSYGTQTFDHRGNGQYRATVSGHMYYIQTSNNQKGGGTAELLDGNNSMRKLSEIFITAYQATSGQWVDHSHIILNGKTFIDRKIDDRVEFVITEGADDCEKKNSIKGFDHRGDDSRNATDNPAATYHEFKPSTAGNCIEKQFDVSFTNGNNYPIYFVWQDGGTITTSDESTLVFKRAAANGVLGSASGEFYNAACITQITPNAQNTNGSLVVRSNSDSSPLHTGWPDSISGADMNPSPAGDGCFESAPITVTLGSPSKAAAAVGSGKFGTGGANGEVDDIGPTCESENQTGFEWLGCLALRAMDNTLKKIADDTKEILSIDTEKYFGNDSDTKVAWAVIRNLANILLLVVGLIVIIATAAGVTVVDAYTLKKVLPRLLIAVIAIQLSWSLMIVLIQMANAMGNGIDAILTEPFNNGDIDLYESIARASSNDGGGFFTMAAIGALGVGAVTLGFVGLLSLAFTTFLAVMVGFLFLILRNLVLVVAVIFAPIAFLAWILPGTHKLWEFWEDTMQGVLLLFPLLSIVFAGGKIFAWVAAGDIFTNGDTSNVNVADTPLVRFIAVVVAFALPYFLVPFMIRFAGRALTMIGGAVNDKSKGVFDRNKKYRENQRGLRKAQRHAGNQYEGKKWIPGSRTAAKAFNRTTVGLGTGIKGNFGLGAKGGQAVDQARRTAMGELMKSPQFNAISNDDDALMAATYDNSAQAKRELTRDYTADARAKLQERVKSGSMSAAEADAQAAREGSAKAKRAVAAASASIGFGRPQAIAAAQQLVTTGTGHVERARQNADGSAMIDSSGNAVMTTALEGMSQTLARASGGNTSTATSLAGFANSETKRVGRSDLAPSFSTLNDLVQKELKSSTGTGAAPTNREYTKAIVKASRGGDAVTILRGKPREVQQLAMALEQNLFEANARGDTEEVLQTAAQIAQLNQSKGYASPENQDEVNKLLANTESFRKALQKQVAGEKKEKIDPSTGAVSTYWTKPTNKALADRWDQIMPTRQNPYDPNLP